jgi:putative endonuclease
MGLRMGTSLSSPYASVISSPYASVISSPYARHFERSEKSARQYVCTPMFVYILASKTRRLYVGVTNDLIRRVWEHRTEFLPGFTKKYGIKQLVYYEQIEAPETAIRREKQVKDYVRVKTLALIESLNPEWHDLAEDWFADVNRADFSLRSK